MCSVLGLDIERTFVLQYRTDVRFNLKKHRIFCRTPGLACVGKAEAPVKRGRKGTKETNMAVRCEELNRRALWDGPAAERRNVAPFPTHRVRARAAAHHRAEIRRRRAAAVALPLLVVAFIVATGPGGTSVASRPEAPRAVVLGAGETIWDLAERFAPESVDPRAYVDAVLDLNGLSGAPPAGQQIRLPE
jgi:hypothetical protein